MGSVPRTNARSVHQTSTGYSLLVRPHHEYKSDGWPYCVSLAENSGTVPRTFTLTIVVSRVELWRLFRRTLRLCRELTLLREGWLVKQQYR